MDKPIVKVTNKEYFVGQISVVLNLNSGPLIHLRLSEKLDSGGHKFSDEETFKKEFFEDICQEQEGTFQWNGITIKFILVGYNSTEARTFELIGLVVKKDLTKWFNQNKFESQSQEYFIYQKVKGKNSWPFFNQVLGDKFNKPPQDFVEKIELLFPDNSCIWRYKDANNFHFSNSGIAFASRRLPEVQGWFAIDAEQNPLRLLLFQENKQDSSIPKLDDTWNASYPFLPSRYSWNRWSEKVSTLSRDVSINRGQEIALIKQLVTDGSNGEDFQKGYNFQDKNPTRLLFAPGTITVGNKNIFCKTITYEFKLPGFEEELPSVTMKIEVEYPEFEIGDNKRRSLRLSGKFQAWEQEKEEETKIKIVPADDEQWGIINEKDQSVKSGGDAVLITHILSPTYSDKKYSGIYVKHEKDDEMIFDIHPCDIPLTLGSLQKYHKEHEEADITVCGEKLAITISPYYQKLDDSEAIILEKSEIKLNHGKQIFGQAMNKVDFLTKTVEIGSTQVNVNSGQMKINSMVNVSSPSPKMPKPIVPAPPPVTNNSSQKKSKTNKPQSKSAPKNLQPAVASSNTPVSASTNNSNDNNSGSSGIMDGVHLALDVAGMIPGVGEIADGINAGLYALKGDWVNAGLSATAMIPVIGQGATAAKLAKKGVSAAQKLDKASKTSKTLKRVKKADELGIDPARYKKVKKTDELGIDSATYEKLRRKTPSQEIRDKINETADKIDPAYGNKVDKLEADHIVPMKKITNMKGFNKLTEKQQLEVLNNSENFEGLGKSSNASKGAKSYAEWVGHSKKGPINQKFKETMIKKEKELESILQKQIDQLLKSQ